MLELRKAFDNCTNRQWKNKRLILVYLITASMPLGVLPTEQLLSNFNLTDQYAPLIRAVKVRLRPLSGDDQATHACVVGWQLPSMPRAPEPMAALASPERHIPSPARQARAGLLAQSRPENVSQPYSDGITYHAAKPSHLSFLISQSLAPVSSGPPLLRLNALLSAAKQAFYDDLLDADDIEAMCVSLLDQVSIRHPRVD